MFKKIDPKLNLPEEELKVLEFWRENKIFEKSIGKESSKGDFVFYEGPPTANGKPGIHHVLARSFKDLFARYKTMQGYRVLRKAGWDTHGLPVELQVEKELGISGKGQIENIVPGDKAASIEKFNKLCRESVWQYKEEWEKLTERMAYWVDMNDPYVTYDAKYIESLWWIISEVNKKGLLYKGHKVVPYCPRCGTALSSHEVAQGYKNIEEESIYIKIRSTVEPNTYFLVWTTTPWTLAGNAALAINDKIIYCKVQLSSNNNQTTSNLIISKSQTGKIFGTDYKIIEEYTGKELIEMYSKGERDYEPIYPDGEKFSEAGERSYKIISGDFVTDTDGTGIVHIAPAFGEDDYVTGFQKNNIKVLKTVDEKGTELAGAGVGIFVKDADSEIKLDLEKRGILFKKEKTKHDYPFCWRCDSPLLYFAKDSWYIAMSKLRDQLIENNSQVNWNPVYLKNGRFGNWLENIQDWALSRDRYWGTPLPVWECDKCKEYRVVSSLSEVGNADPHKPYIDAIEFDCQCGGKMKRTPEVMDVWFDSGAMPFAQYHYPFENNELQQEQFPADFICEAVDQTRGWFYTLLAISTILKDSPAYKNVISTGHVLDQYGKKMSKSKGNIIVPEDAFSKYGADVIRNFFYTVNQPGEPKLYNEKEVLSVSRNLFLTLWNVYSFFSTYAAIDNFDPGSRKTESSNALDKWVLALLNKTVGIVIESLEKYDPYKATNENICFIGELSTWYVRRSRRRFWKSENDDDKESAYHTLYEVLTILTKLIAPMAPMFAETIWSGLKSKDDAVSVHLASYPNARAVDSKILGEMDRARKIVEEGLKKRAEAKIKVRQPLQKIVYGGERLDTDLETIVAEEVNTKQIIWDKDSKEVELDIEISEELKIEGLSREITRNIQSLRKNCGFQVEDRIRVYWYSDSDIIKKTFKSFVQAISKEVLANTIEENSKAIDQNDSMVDGQKINFLLEKENAQKN